MNLEDLVGKRIHCAMKYANDIYLITTDNKIIHLYPYGECCSECFIQHVSIAYALFADAEVLSIENIASENMPKDVNAYNCYNEKWGHKIHTTKGICSIEMRLEGSGNYEGCLDIEMVDYIPKLAVILDDF